jgi:S1-C subfamily serine protease
MCRKESVAARAIRQLSDIDGILDRLSPDAVARRLTRTEVRGELESARGAAVPSVVLDPENLAVHAKRALVKIQTDKEDAILTPPEETALEAIVLLEGRPALLVQGGRFEQPPAQWTVLNQHRAQIEPMLGSVGRIEVAGHPSMDWIGTAFLVAADVVMTNRHVAKEFCRSIGAKWSFEPGMKARIDYSEELGSKRPAEFALTDVIGVHKTFDLSLFRVSRKGKGAKPPRPLQIARKPTLAAGRQVYVVGYPAWDGHRNEPEPMQQIFKDIFNVKRLQPGTVARLSAPQKLFEHDCSTLGGNSGSCVVDLETQRVVGLHFAGRYREANYAVLLAKLEKDALIKKAGIEYA